MNHTQTFLATLRLTILLLMLVACGAPQPMSTPTPLPIATSAPTATPEPPTATAVPEVPEWDYVAFAVFIGYPYSSEGHYAAYIEEDLGVKVNLTSKMMVPGGDNDCPDSIYMVERLGTDQKLRDALGEAEVVTIVPSPCDIFNVVTGDYRLGKCGGEDNMDCVRTALTAFRASCDVMFDETLALSRPGTIVRTRTFPHGNLMYAMQYDVDLAPFYKLFNEQIIQSALERHIPVARADVAFNGPNGDEDAVAKGLMGTIWFSPTPQGLVVIADLWRELGYEPIQP